jgi:hypothetical protein
VHGSTTAEPGSVTIQAPADSCRKGTPMSHKPWLATYRENGIPAEINPNAYRSVVEITAMQRFSDKPAFHALARH